MKNYAAFVITVFFILVFTLRGGTLHENVINLTHLYCVVFFLVSVILVINYLFVERQGEKRSLRIELAEKLKRPILETGELVVLAWVILLTSLMLFTFFYSSATTPNFMYKAVSYIFMHLFLLVFYFLSLDALTVRRLLVLIVFASVPLLSYQQLNSYIATGNMITYPYTLYHRAHGLMIDPNEFAKNVTTVVLLLLFFIVAERFRLSFKVLSFAALALMLMMLAQSGSRGGFVMFFVGGALIWLFFVYSLERRIRLAYYAVMAVCVGVFAVFLLNYDFFTVRFFGLFEQGGNLARMYVMSIAWDQLMGSNVFHFLFGHGIESWSALVPHSTTPHNFIVEYFVEFGFGFGLVIVATLFGALLYPLIKTRDYHQAGFVSSEDYFLLKILFVVAIANLVPGLFNLSIPTNIGFIFFAGLYFSLFRNIKNRYATAVLQSS